jgi:hypothetical protein
MSGKKEQWIASLPAAPLWAVIAYVIEAVRETGMLGLGRELVTN